MSSEFVEFVVFANRLADAARACIEEFADGAPEPIAKGDGSPVTAVDRAVEDRLRELILEAYPDHGIVGEERGATSADRELVWVIDPIDGTLPFLAGFPVYGTLLALVRGGAPVLGVIDMPETDERWVGCQGLPSTRNGKPVKTRACDDLSVALMSTSNPDFYGEADRPALERMKAATRWTVYGGSCMAYAKIASGRIDVGIDVSFDPTDYLALVPVIAGAGGVVTNWDGNALTLRSRDRLIAAGDPRMHSKSLAVLAGS
ncbi:MAG: inositol monophosphatase family protein [Proteobacteria bacterium]|nr:inositol monophosphatase family protein [Pseudomonadota bacterium]